MGDAERKSKGPGAGLFRAKQSGEIAAIEKSWLFFEKIETSGESSKRKRGVTSFELFASLFAGDCAIFLETGEDIW